MRGVIAFILTFPVDVIDYRATIAYSRFFFHLFGIIKYDIIIISKTFKIA